MMRPLWAQTFAVALALGACGVAAASEPLSFERYRREIEPIFLKPRGGHGPGLSPCVTCHVHNGTPLKLEPLEERDDGTVGWSDAQSRRNFDVVSRLVSPGDPDQSRLLLKALAMAAGGARFHVGGRFFADKSDPDWQAMASWVRDAAPREASPPEAELDYEFFESCVQRVFLDKREGLVECFHCHDAGLRGFAQAIPDGRSFWDERESRQNFDLLRRYIEPGFPLRSRFLTHPLAPDAGGDHFHGGGRRWASQDDAEWQMLASWVRGERPACLAY